MKKVSLILIATLLISSLFAQEKIKYDDAMDLINSGNIEKAYAMLLGYQKYDPEFANTYFQLGLIADKWAREYDPLTEYDYVNFFIYNTKLYYGLALLNLKDEKRRNLDLYQNASSKFADEKPSMKEVETFIKQKIRTIEEFEINTTTIVGYFNQAVSNYTECQETFKSINANYRKVKNIWISDDSELKEQLFNLQSNFDTVMTAFANYKTKLRAFPVKNYNQRYSLRNIYTYRLDGLTPANFLNKNIPLWDYKSWTVQILNIGTTSINPLRTDIEKEQQRSDAVLNSFKLKTYKSKPSIYQTDPKLYYQIEKFDYESVITDLFKYRENYINFSNLFYTKANSPDALLNTNLPDASKYYYSLIMRSAKCSEALEIFRKNLKPQKIRKHNDFLLNYYKGLSGLKKYYTNQNKHLKIQTEQALTRYRNKIEKAQQKHFPKNLSTNGRNLTFVGKNYNSENLTPNSYNITDFVRIRDRQIVFTGFEYSKSKTIRPIYGKVDSAENIAYLKTTHTKSEGFVGMHLSVFESGNLVIIEKKNGGSYQSQLIKVNNNGLQISNQELPYTKKITGFKFDDINNTALIILADKNKNTLAALYDLKISEGIFKTDLKAKGEVFSIIKSEKNYLLYINFTEATVNNSKTETLQRGQTGILLRGISNNGHIISGKSITGKYSVHGILSEKITNQTIAVSAVSEDKYNKVIPDKLMYFVTDTKGNIIWENRHD
ncbi:MAG: hypothetical protein U9N85_13365 [Bacteroidota bacterium]|nr:hypothetical protein [Bacteroidota bacterium]